MSYKVSESLLHKVSESLSNKLHSELQRLGLQTSQIVSYTRVVYSIISILEALATRIDRKEAPVLDHPTQWPHCKKPQVR